MNFSARTGLSSRTLGILAMLGAMTIYGTNFAISRHGIKAGLTPEDMNALRYSIAAILSIPLLWRYSVVDCWGFGWGRGIVLTIMSGVPVGLLMMAGLSLVPALHGATIGPGTVTVIGIVGGRFLFGIKPTLQALAGVAVVLCGLAAIATSSGAKGGTSMLLGDLCFLGVGLIWGSYPLMLQLWKIEPLKAAAMLSVVSTAFFMPYYIWANGGHIFTLPWDVIALHGFNQGVLNVLVGLWLWGIGVRKLGVSVAGRFPPLIPVIGTLSGIPIVGEWPSTLQWIGVGLIVTGLMIAAVQSAPKTTPL